MYVVVFTVVYVFIGLVVILWNAVDSNENFSSMKVLTKAIFWLPLLVIFSSIELVAMIKEAVKKP